MVVSTVGLGAEDRDTVVHFNQALKAVCVENESASKKDKSFLVGKNVIFSFVFNVFIVFIS